MNIGNIFKDQTKYLLGHPNCYLEIELNTKPIAVSLVEACSKSTTPVVTINVTTSTKFIAWEVYKTEKVKQLLDADKDTWYLLEFDTYTQRATIVKYDSILEEYLMVQF